MRKTRKTSSFEETRKYGEELAATLSAGSVIALYGNLGAGKTTLVQGIAKGLGATQSIISPTFILIREYEMDGKVKRLYHIDLYRLEHDSDFTHLGLADIFADETGIVIIEWAEKIEEMLPEKTIRIHMENSGDDERIITIDDTR